MTSVKQVLFLPDNFDGGASQVGSSILNYIHLGPHRIGHTIKPHLAYLSQRYWYANDPASTLGSLLHKRLMSQKLLRTLAGLQIRVRIGKLFSLFLIQNICCGYSKEPSQ